MKSTHFDRYIAVLGGGQQTKGNNPHLSRIDHDRWGLLPFVCYGVWRGFFRIYVT